jgi:hypothetical protein
MRTSENSDLMREEQIAGAYRRAYSTTPLTDEERQMLDAAVRLAGDELEHWTRSRSDA